MVRTLLLGLVAAISLSVTPAAQQTSVVTSADLTAAINKLGDFALSVRTSASRVVRRASAELAVPALTKAALDHSDGYVRYRALVLLAGFSDTSAGATMKQVMSDRNDRLRTVAYSWFEHHRDPAILPALIDALPREQSEFVRPALLRALAAYGDDPRARDAILPLAMRGDDDFRGAVIEALGTYRAQYAVKSIVEVAKLDGPLQDDAVTALGKIGDASVRDVLIELQRSGPKDAQPAVAAALVMLGSNRDANLDYVKKSVTFGATADGYQKLLSGAAHAVAELAIRGDVSAAGALFDAGIPLTDPARSSIALAVGLLAVRNSSVVLDALQPRADRDRAIELLRDAFDEISSEDYELERFYVDVRRAYWAAAAGSPRRQLAEALINKLEF